MQGREEGKRFFILAAGIGLAAGLAASLLPPAFFYETALYYSQNAGNPYRGKQLAEILWENKSSLAYFLGIRLFLPTMFLAAGVVKRKTALPQMGIAAGLAAVSFQSALVFGAVGMEGWFQNQPASLFPEGLYLFAAFRAYSFSREERHTAYHTAVDIIQVVLFLLCGVGLEILLV